MKKPIFKMIALLLILIMSITMVACNDMEETDEVIEDTDPVVEAEEVVEETEEVELEEVDMTEVKIYDIEEIKQNLIDLIAIDESEIKVDDEDRGYMLTRDSLENWFHCCLLNDPNDSQEFFDIATMLGEYDERIIDEENHKIWIENEEQTGPYTMVAMKGNFVITIRSEFEPETIIETLDLE